MTAKLKLKSNKCLNKWVQMSPSIWRPSIKLLPTKSSEEHLVYVEPPNLFYLKSHKPQPLGQRKSQPSRKRPDFLCRTVETKAYVLPVRERNTITAYIPSNWTQMADVSNLEEYLNVRTELSLPSLHLKLSLLQPNLSQKR